DVRERTQSARSDCEIDFPPRYSSPRPRGERERPMRARAERWSIARALVCGVSALLVAASCTAAAPAPGQSAGESGGVGAPASTTVLGNGKIAILDSKNTVVR